MNSAFKDNSQSWTRRRLFFVVADVLFVLVILAALAAPALRICSIASSGGSFDVSLSLEARKAQGVPSFDIDSVAGGAFQSHFESFVADHVPRRELALFANSSLMRAEVVVANAPFQFDAIHSRLGSSALILPTLSMAADYPLSRKDYDAESVSSGFAVWGNFIESHPDVSWVMAMVDRSFTTAASPAHDLVSQPADYSYFRAALLDALPGWCKVPDLSYGDAASFKSDYYSSDHHWQVIGAAKAYSKIMGALDRGEAPIEGFHVAYDGPFYGSLARSALALDISDVVLDLDYEHGDFSVYVDGEPKSQAFVDSSFSQEWGGYVKSSMFENVYASYFHADYGVIEYRNPNAPDCTVLVIGDSYTDCMDRLFTESYREAVVVDPRQFSSGETLTEFIDRYEPDDIIALMSANNLLSKNVLAFVR